MVCLLVVVLENGSVVTGKKDAEAGRGANVGSETENEPL